MPSIAILSNPSSLRNRDDPGIARRLSALLGRDGILLETKSAGDVPRAIAECGAEFDILAVNGGDGTLHSVASALVPACATLQKPLPPLVLLRGGTMNTIANGMKAMKGGPLEILSRVLEKHRGGMPFTLAERHTLEVDGGREQGFLFGLGAPVAILRAYYEGSGRGPAKGALVAGRLLVSALAQGRFARDIYAPVNATVAIDGRPYASRPWSVLMAATVSEVGLGFAPFRRTLEKEGRFQIIATTETSFRLARQVHRMYSGDRVEGDVVDELAMETRIDLESDADYMIDGEIKPAPRALRLRAGPRLKFIVG